MTNKEKFLKLISAEDTKTLAELKQRIKNRAMLRESQKIALKALMKLTELGWSQKELAKKMEVSPQQINKIASGKENLTIETQIKLQTILDIPILASYYENKNSDIEQTNIVIKTKEKLNVRSLSDSSYQDLKMKPTKMNISLNSNKEYFTPIIAK
jgi:transcriptional regulator with XRE-family HTH domain